MFSCCINAASSDESWASCVSRYTYTQFRPAAALALHERHVVLVPAERLDLAQEYIVCYVVLVIIRRIPLRRRRLARAFAFGPKVAPHFVGRKKMGGLCAKILDCHARRGRATIQTSKTSTCCYS